MSVSASTSFAWCVIVFGIFIAKRNPSGTLAAHFAQVEARCVRWNEELTSTPANTRE